MVPYCLLLSCCLLLLSDVCVPSAVCFYLQSILILCIAAFLSDCVLSRGVKNEKRNATSEDSESKLHIFPPRKHSSRNKRPAIFIKERGSLNLTRSPTHYEKVRLFARVGLFLHVNANGTVSGSLNQQSEFGE